MQKIKLLRLTDTAVVPKRWTEGSAAVDLHADVDEPTYINPGSTYIVHTGLSIYIEDPGYAGLIVPRSGLSTNRGIVLRNTVGLIDSDYQGELLIPLWNNSDRTFTIIPKDRIAQFVIIPVLQFEFEITDRFDTTSRSSGGFGHTGE